MRHRGPDDQGLYLKRLNPTVGLGHRRLSIIDLSAAGRQPMSNEDGTIWLIFNGEIYNYRELRQELERRGHRFKSHTDTEVAIHLYEEYGRDCVKFLSGMFALAIWDEHNRSLLLARDRLGKKPLLYAHQEGRFCFASEFSALLSSGLIEKNISKDAINYYLSFGYIPAPITIYQNVFKLLPAHTLVLKDNILSMSRYWQLDYSKKLNISEEEAASELLRLLEEAVKSRLYSDVSLGAFLSGGLDSSTVVAIMSKVLDKRVDTFSIGFNESRYNELFYARKIASYFHTRHNEFIVKPNTLEILPELIRHYGEPFADSSCIPTYYVSKITHKYVSVALNGDGGDEALAGYERYAAAILSEKYQQVPWQIRKFINSTVDLLPARNDPRDTIKRLRRFFSVTDLALVERYIYWVGFFTSRDKDRLMSMEFKKASHTDLFKEVKPYLQGKDGLNLVDKLLYLDTSTYLPNDLLVKADIASMANSLELRSPFLDYKVMEFAASLPSEYKLRGRLGKYILKKAVKDILPKENIQRKKMGFGMPVSDWFRGQMKDYLKANLLAEQSLARGYFNNAVIRELVENHINGRTDCGHQLWALLMLELWHKEFID